MSHYAVNYVAQQAAVRMAQNPRVYAGMTQPMTQPRQDSEKTMTSTQHPPVSSGKYLRWLIWDSADEGYVLSNTQKRARRIWGLVATLFLFAVVGGIIALVVVATKKHKN